MDRFSRKVLKMNLMCTKNGCLRPLSLTTTSYIAPSPRVHQTSIQCGQCKQLIPLNGNEQLLLECVDMAHLPDGCRLCHECCSKFIGWADIDAEWTNAMIELGDLIDTAGQESDRDDQATSNKEKDELTPGEDQCSQATQVMETNGYDTDCEVSVKEENVEDLQASPEATTTTTTTTTTSTATTSTTTAEPEMQAVRPIKPPPPPPSSSSPRVPLFPESTHVSWQEAQGWLNYDIEAYVNNSIEIALHDRLFDNIVYAWNGWNVYVKREIKKNEQWQEAVLGLFPEMHQIHQWYLSVFLPPQLIKNEEDDDEEEEEDDDDDQDMNISPEQNAWKCLFAAHHHKQWDECNNMYFSAAQSLLLLSGLKKIVYTMLTQNPVLICRPIFEKRANEFRKGKAAKVIHFQPGSVVDKAENLLKECFTNRNPKKVKDACMLWCELFTTRMNVLSEDPKSTLAQAIVQLQQSMHNNYFETSTLPPLQILQLAMLMSIFCDTGISIVCLDRQRGCVSRVDCSLILTNYGLEYSDCRDVVLCNHKAGWGNCDSLSIDISTLSAANVFSAMSGCYRLQSFVFICRIAFAGEKYASCIDFAEQLPSGVQPSKKSQSTKPKKNGRKRGKTRKNVIDENDEDYTPATSNNRYMMRHEQYIDRSKLSVSTLKQKVTSKWQAYPYFLQMWEHPKMTKECQQEFLVRVAKTKIHPLTETAKKCIIAWSMSLYYSFSINMFEYVLEHS